MEEQRTLRVFPRSLARKMAKAEIGNNHLQGEDWRLAAATRQLKFREKKFRRLQYVKRNQ